jgi:hypothetical protein
MNKSQSVGRSRRTSLLLALLFFLPLVAGSRPGLGDTRAPKIGTRLPSVLTQAFLRNAPVAEPPAKEGWIVYSFSPLSAKSEANHKRVEELARSLPRGWVLLALSTETEGVSAFVERLHVTVPVLTRLPKTTLNAYKVAGTPRTYVLDKDWKLLEVLDGPFEGKVAKKLESRFKTSQAGKPSDTPPGGPPGGKPLPRNLCRDNQQAPYSRGAEVNALGVKLQCGMEGVWVPAG